MSAQLILRIVGIAALVVALLFAVLAIHYYLTRNIRAVMDDLSGKARAAGVARVRREAATGGRGAGARRQARTSAAPAPEPVAAAPVVGSAVRQAEVAPAPVAFAPALDEDEGGTVLVASAFAAGGTAAVASEDDLATEVAAAEEDDLATEVAAGPADEDDLATEVAAGPTEEDDLATMVASDDNDERDAAPAAPTSLSVRKAAAEGRAAFRLTRRIVLIHAQEVIANSEESLV